MHVMNRRGRPGSGELGPGYGLVTEINDLHALLDHTGPDTALVGPSYGALTSSWPSTGQDPHPRCGWGR